MDHSLRCHLCGFPVNNGNAYLVSVECKCPYVSSKLSGLLPSSQKTDPECITAVHFWSLELRGGYSGRVQRCKRPRWFHQWREPETKQFLVNTPCERMLIWLGWAAGAERFKVACIHHADALSPEGDCGTLQPCGGSNQATQTWLLIFVPVRLCVSHSCQYDRDCLWWNRIRDRLFSKSLITTNSRAR